MEGAKIPRVVYPLITGLLVMAVVSLSLLSGFNVVNAWTEPTSAPPDGNVTKPLNEGSDAQTKTGPLTITNTFTANRLNVEGVCMTGDNCGDNIQNQLCFGPNQCIQLVEGEITFPGDDTIGVWQQSELPNFTDAIFYNLGRVGIGRMNPKVELQVSQGDAGKASQIYLNGSGDDWQYSGITLWTDGSDFQQDGLWSITHRKAPSGVEGALEINRKGDNGSAWLSNPPLRFYAGGSAEFGYNVEVPGLTAGSIAVNYTLFSDSIEADVIDIKEPDGMARIRVSGSGKLPSGQAVTSYSGLRLGKLVEQGSTELVNSDYWGLYFGTGANSDFPESSLTFSKRVRADVEINPLQFLNDGSINIGDSEATNQTLNINYDTDFNDNSITIGDFVIDSDTISFGGTNIIEGDTIVGGGWDYRLSNNAISHSGGSFGIKMFSNNHTRLSANSDGSNLGMNNNGDLAQLTVADQSKGYQIAAWGAGSPGAGISFAVNNETEYAIINAQALGEMGLGFFLKENSQGAPLKRRLTIQRNGDHIVDGNLALTSNSKFIAANALYGASDSEVEKIKLGDANDFIHVEGNVLSHGGSGDIDGDGFYTLVDFSRFAVIISGEELQPINNISVEEQISRADINGDGIVDMGDFNLFSTYLMNKTVAEASIPLTARKSGSTSAIYNKYGFGDIVGASGTNGPDGFVTLVDWSAFNTYAFNPGFTFAANQGLKYYEDNEALLFSRVDINGDGIITLDDSTLFNTYFGDVATKRINYQDRMFPYGWYVPEDYIAHGSPQSWGHFKVDGKAEVTGSMKLSGLDCTDDQYANGGKLTTLADGTLICANDNSSLGDDITGGFWKEMDSGIVNDTNTAGEIVTINNKLIIPNNPSQGHLYANNIFGANTDPTERIVIGDANDIIKIGNDGPGTQLCLNGESNCISSWAEAGSVFTVNDDQSLSYNYSADPDKSNAIILGQDYFTGTVDPTYNIYIKGRTSTWSPHYGHNGMKIWVGPRPAFGSNGNVSGATGIDVLAEGQGATAVNAEVSRTSSGSTDMTAVRAAVLGAAPGAKAIYATVSDESIDSYAGYFKGGKVYIENSATTDDSVLEVHETSSTGFSGHFSGGQGLYADKICLNSEDNCITSWPTGVVGGDVWSILANGDEYYSSRTTEHGRVFSELQTASLSAENGLVVSHEDKTNSGYLISTSTTTVLGGWIGTNRIDSTSLYTGFIDVDEGRTIINYGKITTNELDVKEITTNELDVNNPTSFSMVTSVSYYATPFSGEFRGASGIYADRVISSTTLSVLGDKADEFSRSVIDMKFTMCKWSGCDENTKTCSYKACSNGTVPQDPTGDDYNYILSCPANYVAVSGGAWCENKYFLRESRNSDDGNGWKVSCQDDPTIGGYDRNIPEGGTVMCIPKEFVDDMSF